MDNTSNISNCQLYVYSLWPRKKSARTFRQRRNKEKRKNFKELYFMNSYLFQFSILEIQKYDREF